MNLREHGNPRILITRLSHIGDCLLTVPLLCALRAQFAGAMIAWVVERPSDQLLRGHPSLDELIVAPRRWMKSPSALLQLRRTLRAFNFDVAVDPQGLTKSGLLAWLSGARRRISFVRGVGRELAPWLANELVTPQGVHVIDRSLELLGPLGIHHADVQFRLPESDDARRKIDAFVAGAHLGCGFAAINPGAGWASRLWPPERFGSVAKYLGERHSLPSVVTWAGDQERQWAEQIVSRSGGHALLAPPTSLQELAAILQQARVYIGSDTGPMHLSVAVDTPCVSLHGTTRPEISGPYGDRHIAVQEYYQDGSSRERRTAENEAMRAIQVESVCRACCQIIEHSGQEDEVQAA